MRTSPNLAMMYCLKVAIISYSAVISRASADAQQIMASAVEAPPSDSLKTSPEVKDRSTLELMQELDEQKDAIRENEKALADITNLINQIDKSTRDLAGS